MTDTMKKLAGALFAACALCLAMAGTAWAATDPVAVLSKEDGGAVAVSLELPSGARDDVRTLQLTLNVKAPDLDAVTVDFAFDALPGGVTVKEARYSHANGVGRLNLYVAGTATLFANNTLSLGRVLLSSGGAATVEVAVGPLNVVNAAHAPSSPVLAAPVPVTVELGTASPTPPPAGGGEEQGSQGGDAGNSDDAGSQGGGSGGDATAGSSEANRSPGAPSGTRQTLEPTGDDLAVPTAAFAAAALCGAPALALARRREKAS